MDKEKIANELISYVKKTSPFAEEYPNIPRNCSLLEIGIFDSFGIVELVDFIENHWSIEIHNSELTEERFGGIDKMSQVIYEKLNEKSCNNPAGNFVTRWSEDDSDILYL